MSARIETSSTLGGSLNPGTSTDHPLHRLPATHGTAGLRDLPERHPDDRGRR